MGPKRSNTTRNAATAAKKPSSRTTKNQSSSVGSSSTRQNVRRSTRSVVPNSTDSEGSPSDNYVGSSAPKPSTNPGIAIDVPQGIRTSDYATLSPSSREDSIFDGGSNGEGETPETTVTNPTPVESEVATSSRRPNKRVSASARAAELRNSAFSLGNRRAGNKKRPADAIVDGSADAAIARAMQEEEYGAAEIVKKPKASKKQTKSSLEPPADDPDDNVAFQNFVRRAIDRGEYILNDVLKDWRRLKAEGNPIIYESANDDHDSFSSFSDISSPEPVDLSTPAPKPKYPRKHLPEPFVTDSSESELTDVSGLLEIPDSHSEMEDVLEGDNGSENVTVPAPGRPRNRPTRTRGPKLTRAQKERKKLEDRHPVIKTMWETLESNPVMNLTPDPQPPTISRKLKPFQLEGLNWMRRQEQSHYKGGLLGDEMGMGKTIQAVSLLMSDYPAGKPSLVVVPPVALMQWSSEISDYTDGKLKVLVYHNSNSKVKLLTAKDLRAYDVIMISYSGLESMHRKEVKGWSRNNGLVKEDSVIHSIDFHRLILDEAHNIKQRTTSVARACFALKSTYKWCLSGTPVQNRIGEFFSLLRFLEIKPFACYFCKSCPCAELHWSQDEQKRCTHCRHSGFHHVSVFNQEILNPIIESSSTSKRKEALAKLRLLTDRIMLRRVKKDHTSSMELPPKRIEIHNEFFGEIERDFSTSIMTNSTRQFDTYVSRGVMLNNYANIFGLIMQMRQVANHPDLILKKHAEGGQNVLVCSICDEPAEEAIRSRCRHEFCRQCVKDYLKSFESGGEPDCPRCHIPLSIDFEQPDIDQHDEVKKNSIINRIRMDDWTSSTKIEMLVYDLYKLRSKKQSHKSIVFSQFTSMLQLVEWRLRRAGINTVMLDGSMTPAQRQKSIEFFMNNVDVEVFLVSLKAGGVALNLTEASRVFIVDPWWNPAAEWQSADRCHRIGQRRPCVITRLCIEDSVESRMVLLQEKKANMINGTLNKDQSEALEKLTPEDMEFLFRGS